MLAAQAGRARGSGLEAVAMVIVVAALAKAEMGGITGWQRR
ncbi:hypothetical protein [Amycolatopsis sp. cmx-11-51]